MPRRVNLPGASELFRGTETEPKRKRRAERVEPGHDTAPVSSEDDTAAPTGRTRHDEKITVYLSGTELLALEQTRLDLRARHRVAVDRGRLVREALAIILDDVQTRGADSELVRRLSRP